MDIDKFVRSFEKLDYNQIPEKLLEKVFEKEYTLKSLDVSSRTLQSWFDSELLPYDELKGKKHWFNFVHLIWLYIVSELRNFGLPLKTIRNVKKKLLEEFSLEEFIILLDFDEAVAFLEIFNIWDDSKTEDLRQWLKEVKANKEVVSLEELLGITFPPLTELFLLLVQLILGEERFYLTITEQGHVEDFTASQAPDLLMYLGYKTKIILPLNSFFYKYVEDIRNIEFLKEVGILNKFEIDLLKVIHSGDFDKVSIKFKDKKMDILEYSKQIKKADLGKINNVLARKQYQEIIIKTEDGDMRYANVTQKVKIK